MTTPETTWSVRVRTGTVRLTISGQRHQEFEVVTTPGKARWYANMLRRAMRRLAAEREAKK